MEKLIKILLLFIFVLNSCDSNLLETINHSRTVELTLPDKAFVNELCILDCFQCWKISYIDYNLQEKTIFAKPDCKKITLELSSEFPCPILAAPVLNLKEKSIELKAAGAIFPYKKELSWQEGFASNLLLDIYKKEKKSNNLEQACKLCSSFNWEKFIQLCSSFNNPWLINQDKIILALKNKKFSANSVSLKETKAIFKEELFESAQKSIGLSLDNADNHFVVISDYVPDGQILPDCGEEYTLAKNSATCFIMPLQKSFITVKIE